MGTKQRVIVMMMFARSTFVALVVRLSTSRSSTGEVTIIAFPMKNSILGPADGSPAVRPDLDRTRHQARPKPAASFDAELHSKDAGTS